VRHFRRAAFAIIFVASVVGFGCREAPKQGPANVVLIVIDTLRSDHLAHYGYGRETDLSLESFRNQATLFRRAFSTAPWTGPSVASLISGMETARHRTNAHGARLPEEIRTLAEVLREHGYATRGISHNVEVSRRTGFDQGFDDFEDVEGRANAYPNADTMLAPLENFFETRSRSAEGEGKSPPFFVYLQPMNVHGPYRVPAKARSSLLGRPPRPQFQYQLKRGIMHPDRLEARDRVTRLQLASLSEQYDTSVRYTTDTIAEVFALMKRYGVYDDTLIVLTSDHGEELFDHRGFSHGYSLHREVLQVPLLVKLPGQREARTVATRVSLVDVYPTVFEELGLPPSSALDGRSLAPLLRGDAHVESEDRRLLHATSWENRCVARSIVEGRYKLIAIDSNYEGIEDEVRLYDLASDPNEERDIASSSPSIVARLRAELDRSFEALARQAVPEPENVLDRMNQGQLKALGYLAE